MSNIQLLRSYLQDKHNSLSSCRNCKDFGFPCLNCADYTYNYKYGPGYGINSPDVVYLIQPTDNCISNMIMCYTLYETEEIKIRYPNCKVRELKYDKDNNCFK
jgi:hypothetical protein